MFELVKALNDGARVLSERSPNPISLNAGCELFIAFVTLFPHDSDVSGPALDVRATSPSLQSFSDLKKELVKQGQKYATEALAYREKIAELALGFIKDDSIARVPPCFTASLALTPPNRSLPIPIPESSSKPSSVPTRGSASRSTSQKHVLVPLGSSLSLPPHPFRVTLPPLQSPNL